jgi:hypothetical protein
VSANRCTAYAGGQGPINITSLLTILDGLPGTGSLWAGAFHDGPVSKTRPAAPWPLPVAETWPRRWAGVASLVARQGDHGPGKSPRALGKSRSTMRSTFRGVSKYSLIRAACKTAILSRGQPFSDLPQLQGEGLGLLFLVIATAGDCLRANGFRRVLFVQEVASERTWPEGMRTCVGCKALHGCDAQGQVLIGDSLNDGHRAQLLPVLATRTNSA